MLDLGRHGGFILASYAATIVIMGALVWQSVRRYLAAKRRHADMAGPDHG
jgi:heme exporter protein CcmD